MRHEPCAWGDPPEAAMGAGPLNLRRLGACLLATGLLAAAEPPVIPVGADAYLKWERWPYQRIGTRAYMRSTYDRSGGNEAADASHYLYQLRDDFNVTLDVAGPGVLYFVRYNHWHGSPWHYEVDGAEHLVEESNTADPAHERPGSVFLPEIAFPRPVAPTWAETRGADLSWVPIGFEQSFRMAYSRTHYGTGYYIFDQYVGGARLSRPISRWDPEAAPPAALARLFASAGSDIAPPAGSEEVREDSGSLDLPRGGPAVAWSCRAGPSMVRAVEMSVPRESALAFSHARIRMCWDGRAEPSIDSPIALFFGAGIFYNRDNREYLVKSFPMVVRYSPDRVFPHPILPVGGNGAGRAAGEARPRHPLEGALPGLHGPARPGGVLPRHLPRPSLAGTRARPGAAGHHQGGGRGRMVGPVCRHLADLLPQRGSDHP